MFTREKFLALTKKAKDQTSTKYLQLGFGKIFEIFSNLRFSTQFPLFLYPLGMDHLASGINFPPPC
jgi:hypothetical protein